MRESREIRLLLVEQRGDERRIDMNLGCRLRQHVAAIGDSVLFLAFRR